VAFLRAVVNSPTNSRVTHFTNPFEGTFMPKLLPASRLLLAAVSLVSVAAFADDEADAKKVAVTYLNALTGQGDDSGKDLLLGGVTMNAQLFALDNYEFKSKDPIKHEEADLAHAVQQMNELDKAGRTALTKLMGVEAVGDDLKMTEVSQADAAKLMEPTRLKVTAFEKSHPHLCYALRVGKEVYWHPKNPMRAVLSKAGNKGKYWLEVHRWMILSKEGPGKTPREWPLRVMRFKTDKTDTGWKVIPASDWNAE
jgi:hypothetical protein